MIRVYLIELILAGALLWAFGWGIMKLFFLFKREADIDHQIDRRVRRDADDALDDLDHAVARTERRKRKTPTK